MLAACRVEDFRGGLAVCMGCKGCKGEGSGGEESKGETL